MRWREKVGKWFLLVAATFLGLLPFLQFNSAFAQTIPPPSSGSINEICGLGAGSRPYTITITAAPPTTENGPVDIPTTVKITTNLSQNVTINSVSGNLYRSVVDQGTLTKISSSAFTKQGTSTSEWKATFKDSVTSSMANYRYIVRADVSYTVSGLGGTGAHCSAQFRIISPNEGPTFNKAIVERWFANQDIPGLVITVSTEKDTQPKVVVSRGKLGNRPDDDLIFKLIAHYGEGSVAIGNTDWLTFQGYLGDIKVNNLYFVASDDLDANFYYSTNYNELRKGHLNSEGTTEVGRAIAREGDAYERSLGTYFTHVMNLPISSDGSVGGDNCGDGFVGEDKNIAVTGPKGRNLSPEPDNETTLDAGVNGEDARELSQNCINRENNGWLKYWNVTDVFSSEPGEGECGLNTILGAGGFGEVVNSLIRCVIETIFVPAIEWVAGLITDVAGISRTPVQDARLSYVRAERLC